MQIRLLFLALILTPTLSAQHVRPTPHEVRWWHAVVVLGGIGLTAVFDETVQRDLPQDRSGFGDRLSSVVRKMGQPPVYVTVPGVMFVGGLLARRPELRRGGERVAVSLALSDVLTTATKFAVGRLRPDQTSETLAFKPFSGAAAFPSGHATMAFALATSLSDEIGHPWATVPLMALATGAAWSRINDKQHWLSDVVAGAALGITSAQLVESRWQIFHLRPPALLVARGRPGVEWRVPFQLR
jgi:membrane-associated phospholipid phosphatase